MNRFFYLTISMLCFGNLYAQNVPSIAEVESAIETAESRGRIVRVNSGVTDLSIALGVLPELPIVYRTTFGGFSYSVVVTGVRATAGESKLSAACKFVPDPQNAGSALYFYSDSILVSGKSGFKGEMKILPELLNSAENNEFSSEAAGMLIGKTQFYEIAMPGFSGKMVMGLDENTAMTFSCGIFEKFSLSGYVKSFEATEQENRTGDIINEGKPLMFVFSRSDVYDWEDIFLKAKPASGFHSPAFKEVGFHFSNSQEVILDFSIKQNPPELPQCAGVAGDYWQGIYFSQLDVRMPEIVKLKSGGVLPLQKGGSLFIDVGGLLGQVNAEKIISLEDGTSWGERPFDMSLDNVSANFMCGNKINAVLTGRIGIARCDGSGAVSQPTYFLNFDEQAGFKYSLKNQGANSIIGGNELKLSSGSSIFFEVKDGALVLDQKTQMAAPNIVSDVFYNAVCKGAPVTLTAAGCSDYIKWSTGETTSTIIVMPEKSMVYSASCYDKFCMGAQSNELEIKVYENLEAPVLSASRDASPFCGTSVSVISSEGFCPGEIQWSFDGGDWKSLGGGGRTFTLNASRLDQNTRFTYRTRCKLNDCISEPSNEIEQNVLAGPVKPVVNRGSYSEVYCSGVTLYASECAGGTYNWYRNDKHLVFMDGRSVASESEEGNFKYEVKCISASGCESESSGAQYFKIDKCACKPDPPYIQPSTFDKVEYGSAVQIYSSGCGGTVTWYNGGGEFMGSGGVFTHRDLGKHYYRATCKDDNGCESDLSGWTIVEIEKCINMPAAPTVHTSVYGKVEYGNEVMLSTTGCSGTVTWYNAAGDFVGTGSVISHRDMGTHYYRATCTVGNNNCTSGLSNWGMVDIERCLNAPAPPTVHVNPQGLVESGNTVTISTTGCSGKISWYNGGGEMVSNAGSLYVREAGTHYYRATCTVGNACESGLSNWGIAEIGNCISAPSPPVVHVSPQGVVEYGNTVSITATGCGGKITWYNGGGEKVSSEGMLYIRDAGKHYYRATCTMGIDCESALSGWAIAEIGECPTPPAAPIVNADKSGKQLSGSFVTLSAQCSGIAEWYRGSDNSKIADGNSFTASEAGVQRYYAYCKDSKGCKSSKSEDIYVEIGVPENCNKNLPPVNLAGRHFIDALTHDQVDLTWDYDQCPPDFVSLERSEDGVTWNSITIPAWFSASERIFHAAQLQKGKSYWFRLKSYNNGVFSAPGNVYFITIPGDAVIDAEPLRYESPVISVSSGRIYAGEKVIATATCTGDSKPVWTSPANFYGGEHYPSVGSIIYEAYCTSKSPVGNDAKIPLRDSFRASKSVNVCIKPDIPVMTVSSNKIDRKDMKVVVSAGCSNGNVLVWGDNNYGEWANFNKETGEFTVNFDPRANSMTFNVSAHCSGTICLSDPKSISITAGTR